MNCRINIVKGTFSLFRGLRITLKNLLTRAITLQYPSQKRPMTEAYRGLVDLRIEKCIICLQCEKICPTGCLSVKSEKTEEKKRKLASFDYKMELCCFCGLCEQVCPTDAIYMNKIYEIAVYDRKKLDIDLLNREKYVEWTDTAS